MLIFYLLGCGSSAKGIDFQSLRTKGALLGITQSALHTECDHIFTLDLSFATTHSDLFKKYGKNGHITTFANNRREKPDGSTHWIREDGVPPTRTPHHLGTGLRGCPNAGLTAINLAVQLGAKEIYLLGFDMEEANAYWCERGPDSAIRYHREGILENFRYCSGFYKDWGVSIMNASLNSCIDCFPKVDPCEL